MNKKELLNNLARKYETPEFINSDPVQFPRRFKDKKDIEISGLIASSLAYGRREMFISVLNKIHDLIDNKPYDFCLNFDYKKDKNLFSDIIYRFNTGNDLALLFNSISKALKEYGSLEELFMGEYSEYQENIKEPLTYFVDVLMQSSANLGQDLKGMEYLLTNPRKGSACKRLNLYLKWMVRGGPVDLGVWHRIDKSKLIIPLDTHVARLSTQLGFMSRKAADWKSAQEITQNLKMLDPKDPTKYDFALFGYGVSKSEAIV